MKNFVTLVLVSLGLLLVTAPAFAGSDFAAQVPEPMSLSLLAGGFLAIAAVKRARRK
jgi:hypothetical protein